MLDELIQLSATRGAREVVIGMAHRGRLNVLAHNLGRPYDSIFAEFEGSSTLEPITTLPQGGTGDVKYHHGAQGSYSLPGGESIIVRLESNPSHLEFVAPVAAGATRAAQTTRQGPHAHQDTNAAIPVILHGDAAFPGQGVVAETLNLQALDGYTVGGTIHLIQNNQVGFTTDPDDSRSTTYASDLAKGFDVPIIHVNADDVAACVSAVRLAFAFRQEFGHDVLIDLIGYRRFGHNEADEPAYTQPEMYQVIKKHPSVRELFARQLVDQGVVSEQESTEMTDEVWSVLLGLRTSSSRSGSRPPRASSTRPASTSSTARRRRRSRPRWPRTGSRCSTRSCSPCPTASPSTPSWSSSSSSAARPSINGEGLVWAHAEALAFASLLTEGIPIRLTGQDTERGTFSQRHLVLHDPKTGQEHCAMQHLPGALAPMELHNSPLSEMACVGFEYGYSQEGPETLVLWEAQFGDFVNGAQVIIDQFIISGLAKWGQTVAADAAAAPRLRGLGPRALLGPPGALPAAGRRGQHPRRQPHHAGPVLPPAAPPGPDRQAAAAGGHDPQEPAAPAPGRQPRSTSWSRAASSRCWATPTPTPSEVTRLVLCTGKIYYDLLATKARDEGASPHVAIGRVELLYPFPQTEILDARRPVPEPAARSCGCRRSRATWAPAPTCRRACSRCCPRTCNFGYIGRPERAASGEGYPIAHATEQHRILATALDLKQTVSQFPRKLPGER